MCVSAQTLTASGCIPTLVARSQLSAGRNEIIDWFVYLERTLLTVIIGAFTVVAHTASPQNPLGRTLPSKKVRSVRDSFANAKPATIGLCLQRRKCGAEMKGNALQG